MREATTVLLSAIAVVVASGGTGAGGYALGDRRDDRELRAQAARIATLAEANDGLAEENREILADRRAAESDTRKLQRANTRLTEAAVTESDRAATVELATSRAEGDIRAAFRRKDYTDVSVKCLTTTESEGRCLADAVDEVGVEGTRTFSISVDPLTGAFLWEPDE